MNCFSELTYSMYADGELSQDEAQQVELHLSACLRCRTLVNALRVENRVLADTLQTTEAEDRLASASRVRSNLGLLWAFPGMVAVAICFVMAATWLAKLVPSAAGWLTPFDRATLLNLLWTGLFYLQKEGAAMLNSVITALGVLTLGLLIAGAVVFLLRRHPISVGLLAGLTLVLSLTPPAVAVEKRHGTVVTVPAGETINDSLLATGETVDIEGTVNGNLFAFAKEVLIKGTIKGDVINWSQRLEVNGTVEGSVYAGNQLLEVGGHVTRSVLVGAQVFRLNPSGHVDADVLAGCQGVRLEGTVGRDVSAGAETMEVTGTIGRNLRAHVEEITVLPAGRIEGNFEARVENKERVHIEPGATIAGKKEIKQIERGPSRYARPSFYFWQGVRLVAALLAGLVLFWLFPVLFRGRLETAGSVLRTAGLGFLILVATPAAVLISGITLVGLPLALMGLTTWLAGLYLAKILVAALVGQAMLGSPEGPARSFALPLLVGLLIVFVAINLPYLGGWLGFLIMLLGLGMAFSQALSGWRRAPS